MIRLNKTLQFAVDLAILARELDVEPKYIARIIAHARCSKKAYEREDFDGHERHQNKAEEVAKEAGCTLSFPGLYPMISKNGSPREYMLPAHD